MYACSAIHLGLMLRADAAFCFQIYPEKILKTIVRTDNILSVFGAKTPFSNLSGSVKSQESGGWVRRAFPANAIT